MKSIYTLALAATIASTPLFSFAEDGHEHISLDDVPATTTLNVPVKENEAVVVVHGIVCSFCSYGVRKKLSKLDFIDKDRYDKGVHVDIKNQRVTIALKPSTPVDFDEVYKQIKAGGYEPINTYMLDNGKAVEVK